MIVVYILYSSSLEKYYVGNTEDIERRVAEHNSGKGNFTSKGMPWILVASIQCEDRNNAVQLELKIKKRGIKRYLQDNNLVIAGGGAAR
jgi:putative endonuclease